MHRVLYFPLWCRLWAGAPSASLAALILMEVIYCSSLSFYRFLFFFFIPAIVDVSSTLTCKLSVCHFAASGVHSFSLCVCLSLFSSSCSLCCGHREEERREEWRRQWILHALNTAPTCVGCCHQKREGTGDGSVLLWYCVPYVYVCNCLRKCALILANIKYAPSSISLSFLSFPPSLCHSL